MAKTPEEGVSRNPPWARETEEYLLRLPPATGAKLLDPFRAHILQWDKFQDKMRESLKGRWSDSFPWVWEMEGLVPDRCVVTERTFDSVEGFVDCLQTRRIEPSRTQIILVCSNESTKGLIPTTGIAKFDWCTSVVTLALLGSRWKIAPEILFPVIGPWNDFRPDDIEPGPILLRGEQNVDGLDSLRLPSKRRVTSTVSMNYDQIVTETLFFAVTFTPPRIDKDFINTFKFHYDKPGYHFLRLIRVSRMIEINRAVDNYIVVCDSQELRGVLKNYFISRSFFDDRSLREPGAISRGNSPISLVRFTKQYVIDQICRNLDCLKINMEEAKYTGRKDPSYNKLNYVLHLRDHLEMMKRFLDYLAREFSGIPDLKPLDQTDTWPSAFKGDQDYLRRAIANLEMEIGKVHETIKIQIDIKNASRNILFAILASLYLPFSLATGVFGMNIREINDQSTPKWSAVVAFGLPLAVVTVALPLGFNYGYRKVAEFVTKSPKLFRILALGSAIFVGIAVVIVIIIVVLVIQQKK